MPEIFLEFLGDVSPWLLLLLIPLYLWGKLNHDALTKRETHPDSFDRVVGWLRENNLGWLYLRMLSRYMDKLSEVVGDRNKFDQLGGISNSKENIYGFFGFNPFTHESYEKCLMAAFFYPIAAFVIVWVLGGTGVVSFDKEVGGFELEIWQRSLIVVFLIIFPFMLYIKHVRLLATVGLVFFMYFFLDEKSSVRDIVINSASFGTGASLAIFILPFYIFLYSIIFRSHFGIFSIPIVLVFMGGIGSLIDHIATVNNLYNNNNNMVQAFWVISVSVVVISFCVLASMFFLKRIKMWIFQRKQFGMFWIAYSAMFFTLGYIELGMRVMGMSWLLFWVLLPLINAPVDWLSLGVTRGLLQAVRVGQHSGLVTSVLAFADLVLALIFLFLVTAVLVSVTVLGNAVAGESLMDIGDLLKKMRADPASVNHWWIYCMLLSTLMPTLVHFALAGGAVTLWLPRKWRLQLVDGLEHDIHKTFAAWAYLTFMPVIGFVLVPGALLYFLWWLLNTHGGWLGMRLLDWAEMLAHFANPAM